MFIGPVYAAAATVCDVTCDKEGLPLPPKEDSVKLFGARQIATPETVSLEYWFSVVSFAPRIMSAR